MKILYLSTKSVSMRQCVRASVILAVSMILQGVPVEAQLMPVGLQGMHISGITAEQSDAGESWSPGTSNLIFAATRENGIYQGVTWDGGKGWTAIGPFSASPPDIVAMTVQHWGVGPRDGLHLLASIREPREFPGSAVLARKEVVLVGDPTGTEWLRADSGITHGDTSSVVYALTSFYYTGHTPPQPLLGWTGTRALRANAGGIFWEQGEARGWKAVSMDVTPKWFGTTAWASGSAGGDGAIFHSTDQGVSWKQKLLGLAGLKLVPCISVCPGHPDTVCALAGHIIILSTNGMNSWMVYPGMPNKTPVAAVFDPLYPGHVYVAFRPGFNVYRSTNLGRSWHTLPVPSELDPAEITCMTMAMLDTVPMGRPPRRGLFLGTAGTGVWMYDVDMTTVEVDEPPVPTETKLLVYPNPANDAITIQVSAPYRNDVIVELRDILGRVVMRNSFGALNAGTHHHGMSTTSLPPGVYIVRIVGDDSFKPVLLRIQP